MMTPGEIAAVSEATARLLDSVVETETASIQARNWLAWVGIEDEITASAREAAEIKRALYDAVRAKRDAILESAEYDHEGVLEIVTISDRSVGRHSADTIREMVEANAPLAIAVNAAQDTARNIGNAVKIGTPVLVAVLVLYLVTKGK